MSRLCIAKEKWNGWQLNYYILKENLFYEELKEEKISYGIEIEKEKAEFYESNAVKDITCSETKIKQMVKRIAQSQVMPVHLKDVVEDMLS